MLEQILMERRNVLIIISARKLFESVDRDGRM